MRLFKNVMKNLFIGINRNGSFNLRFILTVLIALWALGYLCHVISGPMKRTFLFPSGSQTFHDRIFRFKKQGKNGRTELNAIPFPRPRGPDWNRDPMDYPKPIVFFDISIDNKPAGRIIFELFTKQSPRSAENFRALCTGEKGRVPNEKGREGAGLPLHFKGAEFYRVIDAFICQAGVNVESVFGGMFEDDPGGLLLRHEKKGLLSMANMGPNTNTAHFSIMMNPSPHLDGHYTIFGQVIAGMEVVDKINRLAKPTGSEDERPQLLVRIANSGEINCTVLNNECDRIKHLKQSNS